MLHFPQFGQPACASTKTLIDNSTLPKSAHEVATLVTGARVGSRYELHAHERVGETAGRSKAKVATIVAGERLADLAVEESIAYDLSAALTRGGPLPEAIYQAAIEAFGDKDTAEFVYLIGGYCVVPIILNAHDVSFPGRG